MLAGIRFTKFAASPAAPDGNLPGAINVSDQGSRDDLRRRVVRLFNELELEAKTPADSQMSGGYDVFTNQPVFVD